MTAGPAKPGTAESRKAWAHYWEGDLYLGRPLIVASCLKDGAAPLREDDNPHARHYDRALQGDWGGQMRRIDDIRAIADIDVIQWVSGAGQKPMWPWLDVLKRGQAAGKGLQIYDIRIEDAKVLHRELKPTGLVNCPGESRERVLAFADWLVKHT